MRRLAVIPSDPLSAYIDKGLGGKLEDYYNPMRVFDEVFCLSPLEDEEREAFGMTVIPTKARQLKKRIKNLNISVVRAYGGYWPCDMACYNRVSNVPVVVSVHDRREDWLHDSIKKADIVFAVSEDVRKLVISKYRDPDRVWMLPNRVDMDIMRQIPYEELEDIKKEYPFRYRILHVGRKSHEKNLDTVLKAISFLTKEYCLIAVGSEEDTSFRAIAEELGISERCFFIDKVENSRMPYFFSMADCICNPSRTEAMSNAIIEAMACGAVIITSGIVSDSVNMRNMENGLVVRDTEDPEELADLIRTACTSDDLRRKITGAVRKSAEDFSKELIDRTEKGYYNRVLDMRDSGKFHIPLWQSIMYGTGNIIRALGRRMFTAGCKCSGR